MLIPQHCAQAIRRANGEAQERKLTYLLGLCTAWIETTARLDWRRHRREVLFMSSNPQALMATTDRQRPFFGGHTVCLPPRHQTAPGVAPLGGPWMAFARLTRPSSTNSFCVLVDRLGVPNPISLMADTGTGRSTGQLNSSATAGSEILLTLYVPD